MVITPMPNHFLIHRSVSISREVLGALFIDRSVEYIDPLGSYLLWYIDSMKFMGIIPYRTTY